jgi:hypothetical protein
MHVDALKYAKSCCENGKIFWLARECELANKKNKKILAWGASPIVADTRNKFSI